MRVRTTNETCVTRPTSYGCGHGTGKRLRTYDAVIDDYIAHYRSDERVAQSAMKVGRHTKGNAQGVRAERPPIRVVPLSRFDRLATINDFVEKLFGD